MRRKSRLQAKLTGEEWKPNEPTPSHEEPVISNSEMIEMMKEVPPPELDEKVFEIQMEDPSPTLDLKDLADDLVKGKIDLKKMRKADLLAMAQDMGLEVTSKNTKRQIIAAIEK